MMKLLAVFLLLASTAFAADTFIPIAPTLKSGNILPPVRVHAATSRAQVEAGSAPVVAAAQAPVQAPAVQALPVTQAPVTTPAPLAQVQTPIVQAPALVRPVQPVQVNAQPKTPLVPNQARVAQAPKVQAPGVGRAIQPVQAVQAPQQLRPLPVQTPRVAAPVFRPVQSARLSGQPRFAQVGRIIPQAARQGVARRVQPVQQPLRPLKTPFVGAQQQRPVNALQRPNVFFNRPVQRPFAAQQLRAAQPVFRRPLQLNAQRLAPLTRPVQQVGRSFGPVQPVFNQRPTQIGRLTFNQRLVFQG